MDLPVKGETKQVLRVDWDKWNLEQEVLGGGLYWKRRLVFGSTCSMM